MAYALAVRARGWLLHGRGKVEGLRGAKQSRDVRAALASAAPADSIRRMELARGHDIVGAMLRDLGRTDEARGGVRIGADDP